MTAAAPQPAPLDLDAAVQRIEQAHDHVAKLCSGDARWTMRTPAQPERDSDLVISAALDDAEALVAEVRRLRAEPAGFRRERAILHWAADRLADTVEPSDLAVAAVRRWAAELDAAPAAPTTHQPSEKLIRDFTERVGLLREPDEDYSNEADARALLWWLLSQLGTPAPIACCSRVAGHDCDIHPSCPLSTVPPAGTEGDRG